MGYKGRDAVRCGGVQLQSQFLGDEVGLPGLPSNTLCQNKNKVKATTKRYNRKTTTKPRKDLDTRLSMIDFFETIT